MKQGVTKKDQVTGLNNIRNDEKEALKAIHRTGDRTEFNEIIKDICEAVKEADGRQSLLNIEYDIRRDLKYLKAETSNSLYWIIQAVEAISNQDKSTEAENEQLKEAEAELRADKENEELQKNYEKIAGAIRKKQTALLNVLKSFKARAEQRETLQEEVGDQEEEAGSRSQFKAGKTGKNKYSNRYGITRPNRNPQKCRNTTTADRIQANKEIQAREQAKAQAKANERNNGPKFEELERVARRQRQEKAGTPTADRIRRQAQRKHQLNQMETAYITSIYGERTPQEVKMLKGDHRQDIEFRTAKELETEENEQ